MTSIPMDGHTYNQLIEEQLATEEKRFSYVQYDEQAASTQTAFKKAFTGVSAMVAGLTPGRTQSLAFTKLEEAYMWVGKALRDDQIARNGTVTEQPARTNS